MSQNDESVGFQPTSEHLWLSSLVGKWKVRCLYYMGMPKSQIEVEGTEVVEKLGQFWIFARFEADVLGSIMHGQAATGYDPVKRCFVGTWKDTSTPFHYNFEGTMEEKDGSKILSLAGENYDPMRGRPAIYRSTIKYLSDKEHVLFLSVDGDGKGERIPILEYHYTKVK
jgi:hypothetical protein